MPSEQEEIYRERILDHYEDPYHRGHCARATHQHEGNNPLCGDVVQIELALGGNGKIDDIFFEGEGCRISQAAASILAEHMDGKTVEDVKAFSARDMLDLFGPRLSVLRQKCCLLSWQVLQSAVHSPIGSEIEVNGASSAEALHPEGEHVFVMHHPETAAGLDVSAIRADFPILSKPVYGDKHLAYLDNAASTQRPRQVIDAITESYEKTYANVHRGIHFLSEQSTNQYELARERVCDFIGAEHVEEIIFTQGTTASINTVARSWGDANLKAGDEIVLSVMEHHSNLVPWYQLAERTGAIIKHIPITDDGLLVIDELDHLLTERTKLVAVTALSNVLGTINPIGEIARRAHDAGAVILVDAAQSVPHIATNVQELDVDFLAFSGHKMLGPSGVGVLYGRRELLDAMPPFLGGGSMINEVMLDRFTPAELPAKFEAGTPPIVPVIAMTAAIDYLEKIGLEAIEQHEQMLTRRAHDVLEAVGGVRILGPSPQEKAGIVSFTLEGIHPHDVSEVLDRHGVAVRAGHHCTQPLHARLGITASTRASFYLYNTPEEVDQLGEALAETKRFFQRR